MMRFIQASAKRQHRTVRSLGLGFALVVPVLATACGGSGTGGGGAVSSAQPAAAGDSIRLTEFKVDAPASVKAGKHTYQITNNGTVQHELLVFKSDLTADKYPVDNQGNIDEEGPGIAKVSDGDNLDPSKGQAREVDLSKAGTYLFVCNLPSHFKQGMYRVVTVTP
jgi:uncharacterized cupredoxin-like copper-binding protein